MLIERCSVNTRGAIPEKKMRGKCYYSAAADLDSELRGRGGGGGRGEGARGEAGGGRGREGLLLALLAFLPWVITVFFTQNKGGEGSSPRSVTAVTVRLREVPFVVSIHREAGHQTTAFS